MRAMQIVEFGKPLKLNEFAEPTPRGEEVLVRVLSSGVCHSDLHIWEGFFDLGGGQKLEMHQRGMKLPFTLGHEIAGEVVAVGPDVKGVKPGQRYVVFPWIACGTCAHCQAGDELLCAAPRTLGTRRDGGYATHVLVPHAKYLVDHGNSPIELACTYACSGLTAYSALQKTRTVKNRKRVLLVGAGGVGLAGLEVARATFDGEIVVADIDDAKLKVAERHGAHRVVNPRAEGAVAKLVQETGGGVCAAIDFVGAAASFKFAFDSLRRGGKLVVVGLFGGDAPFAPIAMPFKMAAIEGSYVGDLTEFKELMQLVRDGRIQALPYSTRGLEAANDVIEELKAGKVVGRVVLTP
ncbi:MAG: alcohol dehydrogenase catalytic domain-containing protein [Rhodospirillales bacterium]|nr:MAG: alcohol dehydrogenase catalytic domain-containing protein [Rhodospirillales bacterium]